MVKTVLLLLILCPFVLRAQTFRISPDDVQRKQSYLLLRDGSVIRGRVMRQDSTLITVRKRGGDLSFVEADQLVRILAERPELPPNVTEVYGPSPYSVFVLKDGSQVEGKFVRRDSTMITVRKRNGQLTYFEPELLLRTDSVRVELLTDTSRTFANRFSPWLLTGLTAYNPEKGRFYYRNTWLLLNEFNYGITRFWSVGASFIAPVPYLIYADAYTGWGQYWNTTSRLFTRVSLPIGRKLRLGANASYRANQRYTYQGERGVWTLQALATIGSGQRNVTIGYGIAVPKAQRLYYVPQSPFSSAMPQYSYVKIPNQMFLSIGLMQKVSPNLTFISDNRINIGSQYSYYDDEQLRVSAALRLDRRRHAFDLGVLSFIYENGHLSDNKRLRVYPYVGYNLLIGR